MRTRISVPITLTSGLVAATVALTVGWQILLVREFRALVGGFTLVHWLLAIVGSAFFIGIITASILLTVWLVREIRTNQRQRSFIDAVTHELHTPLASFRLYLDTLRKPDLAGAERSEFLDTMSDDLDRLQATIATVLDAATSEDHKRRRTRVRLRPLLERAVARACSQERTPGEGLAIDVPADASVKGHPELLELALRNLIENALRHGGDPSRVRVGIRAVSPRKLEVVVQDQGPGIPPSALRQIFQRFQRGPSDSERSGRGLGLGLYIVRNIARTHRGSVRAESDGPGRGSRFILTLPGQIGGDAHPAG
ncbi:MAG: sensor histidine kinase [Myxococcota bacterium]